MGFSQGGCYHWEWLICSYKGLFEKHLAHHEQPSAYHMQPQGNFLRWNPSIFNWTKHICLLLLLLTISSSPCLVKLYIAVGMGCGLYDVPDTLVLWMFTIIYKRITKHIWRSGHFWGGWRFIWCACGSNCHRIYYRILFIPAVLPPTSKVPGFVSSS